MFSRPRALHAQSAVKLHDCLSSCYHTAKSAAAADRLYKSIGHLCAPTPRLGVPMTYSDGLVLYFLF